MSSIKSDNIIIANINNNQNSNNIFLKTEEMDEGGISESRLVNNNSNITIMNILKCKICNNILLNPYDCSKCGNTFCYNCINKLKENNLYCPFKCKSFEITPSSFGIKKFLNQLKFECKYKFLGCKEIIPYDNIENHENNCPYNFAICPNAECKQKMKKKDLENHIQNECHFTLFKCKNCGLNLNRKGIILHDKICSEIKQQLDRQSPIINELTKEDNVKNNKDFNSFINILNNLNEDYFYLFDNNNNNLNYSNRGLITLIKCLISLFQYKFGIIETKLNEIDTNIKKITMENSKNNNQNNLDLSKKNKNNNGIIINNQEIINKQKIKKIPSSNKQNKIETILIKTKKKKIDNYNSEDNQRKWETVNLEKAKMKHKFFSNHLYNKEKSLEFFHNRQKSNDIIQKRLNFPKKNISNELFYLGDNNSNSNMSRNKSNIKQNMTFTNFIIHKKRDIENKLLGNRLNKSSYAYYNDLSSHNNFNIFNNSSIDNSYRYYLNSKDDESSKVNMNKSLNNIRSNIYEKKILNSFSSNKEKKDQNLDF